MRKTSKKNKKKKETKRSRDQKTSKKHESSHSSDGPCYNSSLACVTPISLLHSDFLCENLNTYVKYFPLSNTVLKLQQMSPVQLNVNEY